MAVETLRREFRCPRLNGKQSENKIYKQFAVSSNLEFVTSW